MNRPQIQFDFEPFRRLSRRVRRALPRLIHLLQLLRKGAQHRREVLGPSDVSSLLRSGVIVLFVAVLVVSILFSRTSSDDAATTSTDSDAVAAVSVGDDIDSPTSSAWYCPAVPSRADAKDAGSIIVGSVGDEAVSGTISYAASEGGSAQLQIAVPGNSRQTFRPGDMLNSAFSGALVRLNGNSATVDMRIETDQGVVTSSCVDSPSRHWYFADGSTAQNTDMSIALFNPFVEDAIADVSFSTNDGAAEPAEYQGLIVPANGLVVVKAGERIPRRDWIATDVEVRSGRLVASEIQTGTVGGVPGAAMTVMSPGATNVWTVADAVSGDGVHDMLAVYNPGSTEAVVGVQIHPQDVEPFSTTLHVPATSRAVLDLSSDARLPKGTRYSASLRSARSEDVVVSRVITAVAPSAMIGATWQNGLPETSLRWAAASISTVDPQEAWLSIYNPSGAVADVKLRLVHDGQVVDAPVTRLAAGARTTLHLDELAPAGEYGLVLSATQPVAVSRDQRQNNGSGFAVSNAVPLR